MKRWILILAIVISMPIIGCAVYMAAYFIVDPAFDVSPSKLANGDYLIEIDPNFAVCSVYRIEVSDSSGVLAVRDEPTRGLQTITIPGPLSANHVVTVTGDLVYDRPMPSMTTRSETVTLP